MKQIKRFFFCGMVITQIVLIAGCATVEDPNYKIPKDRAQRLIQAKDNRRTLTRLLQTAKTVDDAVKAREHLAKNQEVIEEIEDNKKIEVQVSDGFKSTKERTVVYGPIGWVLVGCKWILDKLYIVYPWNWRAF